MNGGGNLYRAVLNSPTNYTDPSGQIVPLLVTAAAAALGYILLSPGTTNAPRVCDQPQGGDPNAAMMTNVAVGTAAGALTSKILSAAGGLVSWLTGGGGQAEIQTLVHFTNAEGASAIQSAGFLRPGTYVTTPEAIRGFSAAQIESALEIGPGKGAYSVTIQTPSTNLAIPSGGPLTSGGVPQYQLLEAVPVKPGFLGRTQ